MTAIDKQSRVLIFLVLFMTSALVGTSIIFNPLNEFLTPDRYALSTIHISMIGGGIIGIVVLLIIDKILHKVNKFRVQRKLTNGDTKGFTK